MKQYPKRKNIRLKEYDYSKNGMYFITICTQNREHYFGEIVGATLRGRPLNNPTSNFELTLQVDKMLEKWLIELENKFYDIHVVEYIVMPNHVHFIVAKSSERGTGSPLQDIVTWFKTMTTNEYIRNVKAGYY